MNLLEKDLSCIEKDLAGIIRKIEVKNKELKIIEQEIKVAEQEKVRVQAEYNPLVKVLEEKLVQLKESIKMLQIQEGVLKNVVHDFENQISLLNDSKIKKEKEIDNLEVLIRQLESQILLSYENIKKSIETKLQLLDEDLSKIESRYKMLDQYQEFLKMVENEFIKKERDLKVMENRLKPEYIKQFNKQ